MAGGGLVWDELGVELGVVYGWEGDWLGVSWWLLWGSPWLEDD